MRGRAFPMSSEPPPLEECPVDKRLPVAQMDLVRDTFTKNKGFDSYDQYMYSRWEKPEPGEKSESKQGSVETAHLPGHVAKVRS